MVMLISAFQIILGYFFAFSFFAKMRKNFRILCEKSEENEEIAKGRNPPFLWWTEMKNGPLSFFIAFLCDNFLENVIVWGNFFFKKILIITVMESKFEWSRKCPARPFLMLFYVINFPQNVEFCPEKVKFMIFPAKSKPFIYTLFLCILCIKFFAKNFFANNANNFFLCESLTQYNCSQFSTSKYTCKILVIPLKI